MGIPSIMGIGHHLAFKQWPWLQALAFCAALTAGRAAADTNCIDYRSHPFGAGSVDEAGSFIAITTSASGNVAYAINDGGSLTTIDCSDRRRPRVLATVGTGHWAQDIVVSGSLAYVAGSYYRGLVVMDVGNPAAPVVRGYVDTPGTAMAVAIRGSTAYIADYTAGLQVIDVSNPGSPRIVGSIDTPYYAKDVTIVWPYALVADMGASLLVIDVSNPASPVLVRTATIGQHVHHVQTVGNRAYIADSSFGLVILDISNPADPQVLGRGPVTSYADGVAVIGQRAYVANRWNGVQVFDVSDPVHPRLERSVDTFGDSKDVCASGPFIYVADGDAGLQIIDTDYVAPPIIRGNVETPGSAVGVAIGGAYAYVADALHGLQVISIADPRRPVIAGHLDTPGQALDIALSGSYAFIADRETGLSIIDISNPQFPQPAGSLDTPGMASGIAIAGSLAYVADGGSGLHIVDVSRPETPIMLGSVDTPGYALSVALSGTRAYVADYQYGVQVVDVANPQRPQIISDPAPIGIVYGQVMDIAIAGDFIYTARGNGGIDIYPISLTPGYPRGHVDMHCYANCISVADNIAYVAAYGCGVVVVDVSHPLAPVNFGMVDTPGCAMGIAVAGSNVVVADEALGVNVLPVHCSSVSAVPDDFVSAPPVQVKIAPNPTTGRTWVSWPADKSGGATARIYDVAGRLVREIPAQSHRGGEHGFAWDGLDDRSRPVAAGVYFVRVSAPGLEAGGRIVLIK